MSSLRESLLTLILVSIALVGCKAMPLQSYIEHREAIDVVDQYIAANNLAIKKGTPDYEAFLRDALSRNAHLELMDGENSQIIRSYAQDYLNDYRQGSEDSAALPESPTIEAMPGSDTLGDSLYPQMGNGGYDVQHYTLKLDVNVEENFIDAIVTIEATTTQALSQFNLDFHGLTVNQITIDDVDATFDRNGDELTVVPAQPLPQNRPFTTVVAYSGSPTTIQDPSAPTDIGWHQTNRGIFVVSEPAGAKTWYPNNNHPRDKATYTFEITTPAGYETAATGLLTQYIDNGDTITSVWKMDDPMASYLSAVYIGDYIREESRSAEGILIRNYFPPTMSEQEKAPFNQTAEILSFYGDLFGPYPFDAYGSIVVDLDLGFALENQSLSIHGRNTNDLYIIAHEIMHQWTGNHVSPGDWQDIWLNEGFAFYLPFLYMDEIREVEIDNLMRRFYADIRSGGTIGPATVRVDQLFDFSTVYRRGGLTLYALHQQVGDEAFRQIMRAYYAQFGGGTATTQDFIQVAESIGGAEARALLTEWLYEEAVPELP